MVEMRVWVRKLARRDSTLHRFQRFLEAIAVGATVVRAAQVDPLVQVEAE